MFFFLLPLHAEDLHQWTLHGVAPFQAEIIAADGLRATLQVPGRGKTVIPFTLMSAEDAAYVQDWRKANPKAPLVNPERLAPWPTAAAAESIDVQMTGDDAATSHYTYESAHFIIESDLKLPVAVVREIVAVFEATRKALIAIPLGLHLGHESRKYSVLMLSNANDYGHAGGNGGSGGTYNPFTRQMLILLPNLGIKPGTNGLGLDFQRNLFVLKHEVTHQILGRWQPFLPMWLKEGLSECLAATPYTRGRYSFEGLDAAMHDYVLKWRTNPNQRDLQLIPPAQLMTLDGDQWNAGVAAQSAYPYYNSAALLTYYFLHADGKGDGANLAAYFDDIRRGVDTEKAEAEHLLRGRTRENLGTNLQNFGRKLGLNLKIEAPVQIRPFEAPHAK
ncbi:hypothetical protein CfE428DRAFT_3559 [Chthoniobacter flavus Ellin428]|uniref:SLA1 homology domain-containing protein n=1 Tax=Chthoniobacter flavus Ellin428 TaxID=497964 RepID=B4D3S1_9BACT|nr:hypothetical protein [Chthoniobacter flavus]EDY18901.1 hypothetical protein CfE428DRAFT_3559 [Chthoniobacter flavus Ellin428]TCO93490.1 hypothetical protein EV701_104194 [Chthoniobacter flavus]